MEIFAYSGSFRRYQLHSSRHFLKWIIFNSKLTIHLFCDLLPLRIGMKVARPLSVFLTARLRSSFSLSFTNLTSFKPFQRASSSSEMIYLCCSVRAASSAFFLLPALAIPAAPPATESAVVILYKIRIRERNPLFSFIIFNLSRLVLEIFQGVLLFRELT